MPNNLDIDFVAGHFAQFLNLLLEFCVDMAPCRRGPCHVLLLRANLLDSGVVRALLAHGTVFELFVGTVL